MKESEAVERLKDFLPRESYYPGTNISRLKTILDIWRATSMRHRYPLYIEENPKLLHFSRVKCNNLNSFLKTPCICIKLSKNNHIISLKYHLPYKGDCYHDQAK